MTSCKGRLFVCGLLLSIFYVTLGFAAPQGLNLPNGAPCMTSDKEQGICVELKRCASYAAKNLSHTAENEEYVHNSRCGWNSNNEIKICCVKPSSLPIVENDSPVVRSDLPAVQSDSFKSSASKTRPDDCGRPRSEINGEKIFGGREADLGSWPWMVALGYSKPSNPTVLFRCGASLIADEWVLTAAHCTMNPDGSQLKFARLGDLNLDSKVKDGATPLDVPINTTYIHPQYQKNKRNHDIALLRLNKPVKFTRLIQPICLLSGSKFEEDKYYERRSPFALGWGVTETGVQSTALREVTVDVQTLKDCSQIYSEIGGKSFTDNILCAGEPGRNEEPGKDTCQGDSGGPLIFINVAEVRFYLGGVVSAGKECGKQYPGLYMKVAKFIPWINKVTGLQF